MSDPAIEAAQRAWTDTVARGARSPNENPWLQSIDAAREALKPIRKIVEDWEATGTLDYEALLKSIFTTEELER